MSYFNEIFYSDFPGILSGFRDFDEKRNREIRSCPRPIRCLFGWSRSTLGVSWWADGMRGENMWKLRFFGRHSPWKIGFWPWQMVVWSSLTIKNRDASVQLSMRVWRSKIISWSNQWIMNTRDIWIWFEVFTSEWSHFNGTMISMIIFWN